MPRSLGSVDQPPASAHAEAPRSQGEILAALADPTTYGTDDPVVVCETHASWVFLTGRRAYKVKKPVRLAFLDYSTLERRRAACEEELRVNRELAGDIYQRVLAILPAPEGIDFAPADAPGATEYALQMRRFDERQSLAGVIAERRLTDPDLDAVAGRIARFHAGAPVFRGGGADAVLRAWEVNLDELEQLDPRLAPTVPTRRFGEAFVRAHRRELDRRAREGMVRDGHGDLRCEHVLLGEPVRIVDRIEFDPALRRVDVGWDLAFLLMDLELRGQVEAAERLLASYRSEGGDPGSDELVWFFAAYWALVRAKVAGISASQHPAASHPADLTLVVRLLELAERLCWRARGPQPIVVAGPPASGKSTLAGELSRRAGLPVVSTDVTRKLMAGLDPSERAPLCRYTPEHDTETYREVGHTAARRLAAGTGIVIDATCATSQERTALLGALGVEPSRIVFAECRVPLACALERSAARMRDPNRVSDATPEVVTRLFASYEPPHELAGAAVIEIDGRSAPDEQVERLAAAADSLLASTP